MVKIAPRWVAILGDSMAPDMMHSLHASQSSMSSVLDLAPLSPKTLGETEKLPMNYEGSYKPARVGLQRALQSGQMRNPLQMRGSKHEDMTYLCNSFPKTLLCYRWLRGDTGIPKTMAFSLTVRSIAQRLVHATSLECQLNSKRAPSQPGRRHWELVAAAALEQSLTTPGDHG